MLEVKPNKNKSLQNIEEFTKAIPTIRPLEELDNKHETHFTILYVLVIIIVLTLICYKLVNKYKNKICKGKTSDETKIIEIPLSTNRVEHQISFPSNIS